MIFSSTSAFRSELTLLVPPALWLLTFSGSFSAILTFLISVIEGNTGLSLGGDDNKK